MKTLLTMVRTLTVAALALAASRAFAADITKTNNTDTLNLTTSWVGGAVPGSGDVAVWDSTVTAANATLLGANTEWQGIRIANPGGGATINTGNTLTLGTAGIDLVNATQNLTFNNAVTVGANQTWDVKSGRTLILSGAVAINNALTLQGAGTIRLQGTQSGSGAVTSSSGTLRVENGKNLGTGTLTINGGTLANAESNGGDISLGNSAYVFGGNFMLVLSGGGKKLTLSASEITLTTSPTITVSSTTYFNGNISGTGYGLTKVGVEALYLNGAASTFDGPLAVTAGTLYANGLANGGSPSGAGASGIAATNLLVGSSASLRITGGASTTDRAFTVSPTAGSLYADGTSLNFSNTAASVAWGTTDQSRSFTLRGGSSEATLGLLVANNGTGVVTLNKNDAGRWILANTGNSYSGNTTITAGALQAADGAGLPSGSYLQLDGGVLQSDGAATFTRGLAASGASKFRFTANGGGFAARDGQMTVNIGGGTAEQVWGSTLGTHIVGTLKLGSATANARTLFPHGIDLNGATRTIDVALGLGGDTNEVSGVIRTSSGTAGLTKTGSGLLLLSQDNTYNGLTTLSAGTLVFPVGTSCSGGLTLTTGTLVAGNNASFGSGTLTLNGGTVQSLDAIARTFANPLAVGGNVTVGGSGDLTFADTGSVALGASRDFTVNNPVATFASSFTGSTFNFTKKGLGMLVLSGDNSGVTGEFGFTTTGTGDAANAGAIRATNDKALGGGTIKLAEICLLDLRSDTGMDFSARPVSVQRHDTAASFIRGATVTINVDRDVAGTGVNQTHTLGDFAVNGSKVGTSLAPSITVTGDHGYNLACGAINYARQPGGGSPSYVNNLPAGSLWTIAGLVSTTGAAVDGTMAFSTTLSGTGETRVGNIVQNGNNAASFTKSGTGLVVFTGTASSYTGTTTVAAGTLRLAQANAFPTVSKTTLSGGVLELGAGDFVRALGTAANQVVLSAGGFSAYGADRLVNIGGASGALTWGATSFLGNGNTFVLGSATADGTLTFQNPLALGTTAGTRTIHANDGSANVDGKLSGLVSGATTTVGLVKTGDGTLELSADNSYVGSTTVNQGRLIVSGVTTNQGDYAILGLSSSVTSTLAGTGTIRLAAGKTLSVGGASPVGARGVVYPGTVPGDIATLTVNTSGAGGVSFLGQGVLRLDLGASGLSDQLVVNGNLTIATDALLDVNKLTGTDTTSDYTLLTCTGTLTGAFSPANVTGLGSYTLDTTANAVILRHPPLGTAILIR